MESNRKGVCWTRMLFVGTLQLVIYSQYCHSEETAELCFAEVFNATCGPNNILLITGAQYGRMKIGKCIDGQHGTLGCFTDVLEHMEEACSGKRSCNVPVTQLSYLQPCSKDLNSYLEVSYKCLELTPTTSSSCRRSEGIALTKNKGNVMYPPKASSSRLFSSFKTPGKVDCPWTITVAQGQKVNLTAYILSSPERQTTPSRTCSTTVVMLENDRRKDVSLCGDASGREIHLHVTESSYVKVFVSTKGAAKSHAMSFILNYKAVGCTDPERPLYGWMERENDILKVRCNFTDETWYLTCVGAQWIGDFDGNCSKEMPQIYEDHATSSYIPYGIIFAVLLGVVLGVLIGALLLALVHWYRRRYKHSCRNPKFTMVPQEPKDKLANNVMMASVPNDSHLRDAYPVLVTDSDIYGANRRVLPHEHCFAVNTTSPYKTYSSDGTMYHRVEGKLYECPAATTCAKCDIHSSRYTSIDTDFEA